MIRKHQLGTKLVNQINNSFDKPKKFYNKINSSPVNINNLVKYKDEYDNIFMDQKLLKEVDNYMIKRNVGLPQRQAILYTIWQEGSKIGPHGNGSGYKSGKEAQQAFLNAKTYSDAVRALNYGYVRPPLASIQKRISTKNMFKKGGKLQKLQYGSPIYYDQDKGYVTNNIPLTLDNNGNLYANGQKGTVMLPEVTINGKGNITTRTLLNKALKDYKFLEENPNNLAEFLGQNKEKISNFGQYLNSNNIIIPSRKLTDEEIYWYNKYIGDKLIKRLTVVNNPDSYPNYIRLNSVNKGPDTANEWEEFETTRMKDSFNQAKYDQTKYYNSEEYKRRLNNLNFGLFNIMNKNILNKMSVIPYKNYKDSFKHGPGVVGYFNTSNPTKIYYNTDFNRPFTMDPYETMNHELSHAFDYNYPILNKYNQKYIKLNPYLSDGDQNYYGNPSEIRARAMEILIDYLNNKNKYNSIEDFINKESENHNTIKELKYIFKDEKSLFDYMNNFVQNDTNPIDKFKNWYGKQGGKLL